MLVPLLYLAAVLCIQPPGYLGSPVGWPGWAERIVYDDFDTTAMALRGLNATLGRTPGRMDEPAFVSYRQFLKALDHPGTLQPHYFLEYPHAAVWLFRLGYVFQPQVGKEQLSPAILDACHNDLVMYVPRHAGERLIWRQFRRAIQVYNGMMIGCLLALMAVLRWGYEPGQRLGGAILVLILPGALYFTLNRFDIVPALLVALSLACLGRRWLVASAAFLAAATLVKVYPVLLVPLLIRYLSNHRRGMFAWMAAYGATVLALLLPPLLWFGWAGTWAPYHFQLSRTFIDWATAYGYVMPKFLAGEWVVWRFCRLAIVFGVMLGLAWHRPADLDSLLRRAVVILIVFVSVQVFYSPQWILWFSPLLIPLARQQCWILPLTVALDVVTYLTFPISYDLGGPTDLLVYARFLVLALLAWVLLRAEFAERVSDAYPYAAKPALGV